MTGFQQRLRGVFSLCFLFVCILFLSAQGIGSWRTHLPFYDVTDVVETPNKVFGLASGSLFSYSPDDQEIKKYGKYDGLNDVGIGFIAYSEEAEALLIVYENTNVDILTNKGVYNFTGIIDKADIDGKMVNSVNIIGKMAYLSSTFGVTILDLQKKESPDTYMIGNTYAACVKDQYIYVATNSGIRRGLTSKNLSSEDNWEWYDPGIEHLQTWNINRLLIFQKSMIFQQKYGPVFYKNDEGSGALSWDSFKDVRLTNDQLVGIAYSSVHFWTELDKETTLSGLEVSGIAGRKQGTYWIAQNKLGFGSIKKEPDSNEYTSTLSNVTFNTPANSYSFSLRFQNNKLLVTGGKHGSDRLNRVGTFMILENGKWYNFDPEEIEQVVQAIHPEVPAYRCLDFIDAIEDPARPGRYYVSSYGEGLYVFEDNKLIELYTLTNSPLIGVKPDEGEYEKYHYIRLGGLAFDSRNNLHVGINKRVNPIQILSSEKVWAEVPYNIGIYAPPLKSVLITSKKQKWINFSQDGNLLLIEDNNTPLDFEDDKIVTFQNSIVDQKGESFAYGNIRSIIEDSKGAIWIGTDKGPAIFYSPQNAIANPSNFYCTRPILPYGDGTDDGYYLLGSEQINAIAVDGANRKWLGTERSGVYLVSENGMEILEHFTEINSPLLSDLVHSIAIDSNTGEVFFATEKGLCSYMGDASAGKSKYSEVRAYPNPVRPEMQDVVTVTNLIKDSSVKITDARGNLIYEGTSKGGMFTWKCVDNRGERVPTGMYLVFAAKSDGSEGVVTKIMVIK